MTALYAIGAAIVALIAVFITGRVSGKSSAQSNQIEKERDSYEKHLNEIADANNARNRVQPTDSVSDDPYRRD